MLRSRRLGREVRPRITNAHNHQTGALPFYRFLGALQSHGANSSAHWTWGPLASAPYLPRVVCGDDWKSTDELVKLIDEARLA